MQKVIYRGEATQLSRFGLIQPGDILDMREEELATVLDNPRYEVIIEDAVPDAPAPVDNGFYRLTTIDWKSSRLYVELGRKSKLTVVHIGYAMRELGLSVNVAQRYQKYENVDAVIEAARRAGWTRKPARVRRIAPKAVPAPPADETAAETEARTKEGINLPGSETHSDSEQPPVAPKARGPVRRRKK